MPSVGGYPVLTSAVYQTTADYFRKLWTNVSQEPDLFHSSTVLGFYEAMARWVPQADLSRLPVKRVAYYGASDFVFAMVEGSEANSNRLHEAGFAVHAFDGLDHDQCAETGFHLVAPLLAELQTA